MTGDHLADLVLHDPLTGQANQARLSTELFAVGGVLAVHWLISMICIRSTISTDGLGWDWLFLVTRMNCCAPCVLLTP